MNEFVNTPVRNRRKFGFLQNLRASIAGHLGTAYLGEAKETLNGLDEHGLNEGELQKNLRSAQGFWINSDHISDEVDLDSSDGRLTVRN